MTPAKNLMHIGTRFWYIPRIHPEQGRAGTIVCKILYGVLIFYAFLIILLPIMNRGEMTSIIDTLESFSIYLQSIGKIPTTLRKKDLLRLMDVKDFWNDPNDNYVNVLYFISSKSLKLYTYVVVSASMVTMLLPFVTEYEGLSYYIPNYPYADKILPLIQLVHLSVNIFYIIGVDVLFCSCCINLLSQFHLLHKAMRNLKTEDVAFKKGLKTCLDHHHFLLNYMEHMQYVYNKVLFLQYLISMYTICLSMIKLAQIGTSISYKIRCFMIILAISMELAGYCFTAFQVTIMSEKTAEAIYDSKWYETQPENQKLITLILMRSQKPFIFNGLGIFNMTRESYLAIYKSAVSMYTFLAQMKDN